MRSSEGQTLDRAGNYALLLCRQERDRRPDHGALVRLSNPDEAPFPNSNRTGRALRWDLIGYLVPCGSIFRPGHPSVGERHEAAIWPSRNGTKERRILAVQPPPAPVSRGNPNRS